MGASRLRKPLRAGLVLVGLLAGAGLLALALLHRETPQRGAVAADAPAVTVIEVAPARFRLEARGYGVARAAERWHATANVGGRVVERHARLESGNILAEGTQLLALDPTRYQLAIADAEAEIASLDAELEQLDTEEANTRSLLGLERERLALAEEELSRIERLAEQGSVSRSQRDEQRRATIAQRQAVAKLDNELSLIPVRRNRLEAQRERARTRVQQAREDLEDTRFTAPYDLRVSAVEVERHDQVSPGQVLFEADSVAATEVEAHIQLPMLRRLMGGLLSPLTEPAPIPLEQRVDLGTIDAEVTLASPQGITWPARVTRIASGMDPVTRTMRVVVTVDEPYRKAQPPERPPLQPGMYARVRLTVESPEPRLVVPASAVHDGEVYRVDDDDRLQRRAVNVAFEQNDLAVIGDGLEAGDRVIVDDITPAVTGMKVEPHRDEALERSLRRRAGDGVQ